MHVFTLPFLAITVGVVIAAPSENSFVTFSTSPSTINENEEITEIETPHPIIYAMEINSNISNRFAKTQVVSRVKNSDTIAKEATFTVILPDKAFISGFVMEIGDKSYKAYVKEKEEAKHIYDEAVAGGQSAGHVTVSARDSNRFTVSVNIEPQSKAAFLLTYEELLERKDTQYDLILNIRPGQIVKDMHVKVFINESRPLKFVRTPSLRSGNEISKNDDKLDPSSNIQIINSTSAIVLFSPDPDRQRQFGIDLGVKENEGLAGQFIVQYDVERDPTRGEVLLQDGYFVHFFAPDDLKPLPKHVVFVLDTSGSMVFNKLNKLKDAMNSILDQLNDNDIFHIVEFNTDVYVWNIDSARNVEVEFDNYQEPFNELTQKNNIPSAMSVTRETIGKAKHVIEMMESTGITNIIGGLETGIHLIKTELGRNKSEHQPMIFFLTDGEPNKGVSSTEEITNIVTRLNTEYKIPIFSLSFGNGADKTFLRDLSLKNFGFSRHIYDASDASIQLQDFYRGISSPLLSNVHFEYTSNVENVTKTMFPIYFKGSEIVVSGCFSGSTLPTSIHGRGLNGSMVLSSNIEKPVGSLERLWAYLTVKQKLLERKIKQNKDELTSEILDLALKYSFVTEVTSLVVVKPNETRTVEAEDASNVLSGLGSSSVPYLNVQHRSGPSGLGNFHYLTTPLTMRAGVLPDPYSSRGYISQDAFAIDPYRRRGVFGRSRYLKSDPYIPADSFGSSQYSGPGGMQVIRKSTISSWRMNLPWLSGVLIANDSINIEGDVFEIGENSNITSNPVCPKSPIFSSAGRCTLLKDCPEVYRYLTDFQVYKKYFCPLENKFAGVCCPNPSPDP